MKALTSATAELLKPLPLSPHDRLRVSINKELTYFQLKVTGANGYHPSLAASRTWLARIPERREVKGFGDMWEVAATDYSAEIINAVWPAGQVEWDADAKAVADYLLATGDQLDKNADIYARFKEAGEVPTHALSLHPELPLKPYQQVAGAMAINTEGYGLFMEQGTGKTPVVITTICTEAPKVMADEKRMHRTLIVCPNNVRANWQAEIARFCTVGGKVTVLRGGQVNRVKLLIDALTPEEDCQFTVIICSYETLVRMWDTIESLEWDLGVLDESHAIKWPETQRFKYTMRLREKCRRRMVLTGTPITNTALDLYSQFEFMGKGWSGFQSWKAFRTFYGVFSEQDEEGHSKLVGVQNLPFMKERLARTSFIVRKSEVLSHLPPKMYDIIECEMTARQAEVYEQVASQLAVEIEDELDSSGNKAMTINNILTKLLRLAQITSGFVVWDAEEPDLNDPTAAKPKRKVEYFNPVPKLEMLVDELKQKGPNDKTIVWACWRPDLLLINERLKAEGIDCVLYTGTTSDKDRASHEERFNKDPNCKVWIANAAAGGTGLNLLGYDKTDPDAYTTNVTHEIYYSQNWSPVQRWQSEDRAHRMGTRVPVRVSDLCVPETIDELIRTRVMQKQKTALEISDIREILHAVLAGIHD